MKGWKVIHNIKKCKYDGLSQRAAARLLHISRTTVQKYWQASVEEITELLNNRERIKELDAYQDFLIMLLQKYPLIKVPKLRQLLERKGIKLKLKDRAFRNYLKFLKARVLLKQKRNYAPIINNLPGVQAQVDLGEERKVLINGTATTVYFAVMVLSFSRKKFASWSLLPFNTNSFLEFHDAAFRYFGGVPEELLYDQTKLVVLSEKYREVFFNDRFYQYTAKVGFNPWICEGYDPESKGKVEAAVKFIKNNFLYAEEFNSFQELKERFYLWLEETANRKENGTTLKSPEELFQEEQPFLKPYSGITFSPVCPPEIRKVDKTGLISFEGNKYSVPELYQRHQVLVQKDEAGDLLVLNQLTGALICKWPLSLEKGRIFKNNNHYRDHSLTIRNREEEACRLLPDELTLKICRLLKQNNPRIYKDQLVGLCRLSRKYPKEAVLEVFKILQDKEQGLKVSLIEEYLKALGQKPSFEFEGKEHPELKTLNRYQLLSGIPVTGQHDLEIYQVLGGGRN